MSKTTPKRSSQMKSPSRIPKTTPKIETKSPHLLPSTPLRRSSRFAAAKSHPPPPEPPSRSRKSLRFDFPKGKCKAEEDSAEVFISPASPDRTETRKNSRGKSARTGGKARGVEKRRVYYRKVEFDGGEFEVGDDVYVKRREGEVSDDEDPEVEECRVCFRSGGRVVMIECDDCLGGFHLKCLKPPLKEVPEGDWICGFCEAKKLGKEIELPEIVRGRKRVRTAKEKLLKSDLYAARIER